jgi:hypothetical protein
MFSSRLTTSVSKGLSRVKIKALVQPHRGTDLATNDWAAV